MRQFFSLAVALLSLTVGNSDMRIAVVGCGYWDRSLAMTFEVGRWGQPGKAQEVLVPNPFQAAYHETAYRTGDLVTQDVGSCEALPRTSTGKVDRARLAGRGRR
jgi:hypothetical protein